MAPGNPAIRQGLDNDAAASHLTVGANTPAMVPTQPIRATEAGPQAEVFPAMGAQARQLARAQVDIRVELERLADEHKAEDPVNVVATAEILRMFVKVTTGAIFAYALDEALDQLGSFVLFGQTEAETGHRFGDIESLLVV